MDETTVTTMKAAIAAAVATMTALWGWFGWLVIAWVLLMLADWLIGSAAAAKEGRWSSAKMREGAWHKGGMILVVCIALVADWLIGTILGHIPAVSLPFEYSVLLAPLVIESKISSSAQRPPVSVMMREYASSLVIRCCSPSSTCIV